MLISTTCIHDELLLNLYNFSQTLMNVRWVLTPVPRSALTRMARIAVAVTQGMCWIPMDGPVMVRMHVHLGTLYSLQS